MELATLLPRIGIPIVTAGLATGLAVGMHIGALLESFGEKFRLARHC